MPQATPQTTTAPAPDVRAALVRLMRATLEDRAHWTYHAVRPLPVAATWKRGQRVTADCSHAVKLLCRWAGAPDPMNGDYGQYGNSQTLAVNLPHVASPASLAPGDIVTFGPGGSSHAAMVLVPGGDPLMWSFGHQGAPNTYQLSQDRRTKQYLRLPVPVQPPPLEEQLRSRTGYWAWLAWTLGEGDWKPYGKFNKQVRPNVPKLIPPKWWATRLRYLLARRKPNKANG